MQIFLKFNSLKYALEVSQDEKNQLFETSPV